MRTNSSGDSGPLAAARDGLSLAVWVTPGRRRSELAGVADGLLRVRIAAPPTEGRANLELVRFLAGKLDVPRHAVTVVAGTRSRRKLVRVTGVTLDDARRRLAL